MKTKRRLKRELFDPDKIATAIRQTLNRDLSRAEQLYGMGNSVQRSFREAQQVAVLKKYDSAAGDTDALQQVAFQQFREVNDRMERVNRNFRRPRSILPKHWTSQERMLIRAQWLCRWVLGDITWGEIAKHCSNSSGVTQGVRFSDTSAEAKFTWPITGTLDVVSLFEITLTEDKRLSQAIEELNSNQLYAERYEICEASRATTVPKDDTKRRMIAIEPTLNMYFQQGLMAVLFDRLRKVGLDVESLPSRHRELAYEASLTGQLSTIDFSSASDCVSIELLRWLLPPRWFAYVSRFRCHSMNIDGETVKLHMISTMGNAGTFPLETLVFWCLGVSAVMQRTRCNPNTILSLPEDREAVSVFGDDCILPTADAQTFMDLCTSLGFTVNREKSFFNSGPGFRESCGGDFLRGINVRPFYLRAPTSNRKSALEPWLYTILNLVLPKYISYFGSRNYVYDQALLSLLFDLFRKNNLKVKIVPPDFPDDSGLKTLDLDRLKLCYGFRTEPVRVLESGWWSFRYMSFRFPEDRQRFDHLRYAMWLKSPTITRWWDQEFSLRSIFPIRRKGSYVVARSIAPPWG